MRTCAYAHVGEEREREYIFCAKERKKTDRERNCVNVSALLSLSCKYEFHFFPPSANTTAVTQRELKSTVVKEKGKTRLTQELPEAKT